jgi:hypothetical protein
MADCEYLELALFTADFGKLQEEIAQPSIDRWMLKTVVRKKQGRLRQSVIMNGLNENGLAG